MEIKDWLKKMTVKAAKKNEKNIQLYLNGEQGYLFLAQTPKPGSHEKTLEPEKIATLAQGLLDISLEYPGKHIKQRKIWAFEIPNGVVTNCAYHVIINQVHPTILIVTITATLTDKEVADVNKAFKEVDITLSDLIEKGNGILSKEGF